MTRIGSAEIPTDPMPVERADMLIVLKHQVEWTSARTKNDLQERMEETLSVIPVMDVEMSQPIQMRNNELVTGIRQPDTARNPLPLDSGRLPRHGLPRLPLPVQADAKGNG